MRLSELKNILNNSINGENKIELNHKSLYNNQRYLITNFNNLYNALATIKTQSWVTFDTLIIDELQKKYDTELQETDIDPQDFQKLQKLIEEVNSQLPMFMSIINSFVREQSVETINIRLPISKDTSLSSLSKFNESIDSLFTQALQSEQIKGVCTFNGFSSDGEWIEVSITGSPIAHIFICGVLHIATSLNKLKQEWQESEETQLNVMIIKKKTSSSGSITTEDINTYISEKLNIKTMHEAKKLMKALEIDTASVKDISQKAIKTVNLATQIIDQGGEFQPSSQKPIYLLNENSFELDLKEVKRSL